MDTDIIIKMTNRMSDEEVFDLLEVHPSLCRYPSLEWQYWFYDKNRDIHRAVTAKIGAHEWLAISRFLTPRTLWSLQQALPYLLTIKPMTATTRKWKLDNPFACPQCQGRTDTATSWRVHMAMAHTPPIDYLAPIWYILPPHPTDSTHPVKRQRK